jgi:hypothetical protein
MALGLENSTGRGAANWRYRAAHMAFAASAARLALVLHAGFRPEQPRVPAGSSDGGQWTKVPVWARGRRESARGDLHLVGGRGRRTGAGQIRINGRLVQIAPAQEVRLRISERELEAALSAVRRYDSHWKPRAQIYETVEGAIAANQARTVEARAKLQELTRQEIGVGPFVSEGVPNTRSGRKLTRDQQAEINRIGRKSGCHRCGSTDPRTPTGNFIGDHQPPWSCGLPSMIYPHCGLCSVTQGGLITGFRYRSQR